MKITSFHALASRWQYVWRCVRFVIPSRQRFFFEGNREIRGQLWYAERKLLFETTLAVRPKVVFEIGTWEGGGSTLFLAQALHELGGGVLHTVEVDPDRHAAAVRSYESHVPRLMSMVHFHRGASVDVLPEVLAEEGRCDLLFMDGAQDAQQTLDEFEMISPYFRAGSILIAHDWDNQKMALLRPRIENDARFRIMHRLTTPVSVGMIVALALEPSRR